MPIILSGYFNVNFASEVAQYLIDFLDSKFNFKMNNDDNVCFTKSGSTIYTVFDRYFDNLQSKTLISYFNYHKPTVYFLEYESMEPLS